MIVKKARGGKEKYKSYKVVRSCKRCGFSESEGKRIEREVRKNLKSPIDVKNLEERIYRKMEEIDISKAMKYRLRESIAALDPNKHEFEFYIAKLFDKMGFDAERSPKPKPQGECIEHEIDVLAFKQNEPHIIECKHHYHFHRFTGLGVPMRERARLLDLRKGFERNKDNSIDPKEAWVLTNTKVSEHAKKYSRCKGLNLLGWNYPENSLAKLAEKYKVYPIPILMISDQVGKKLSERDILTLRDLISYCEKKGVDKLGISPEKGKELKLKSEKLVEE